MSKDLVTHSTLSAIAGAIRVKLGVNTHFKPDQMAAAIGSIPTGYPEPTGTVSITQNGTVNVKDYASASVNVAGVNPVALAGMEQGGINYAQDVLWENAKFGSEDANYTKRVRSKSMISVQAGGSYTISVSSGFQLFVFFLDSQCGIVSYTTSWAQSATFTADYPYLGVIVRASDNAAITPSSGFVVSFAEN